MTTDNTEWPERADKIFELLTEEGENTKTDMSCLMSMPSCNRSGIGID